MVRTELKAFTDRRSITALFRQLQERDPQQPRQLLPILTIIGPEGSGKRTLMQYLYITYCQSNGLPTQPYAYLDFNRTEMKNSILSILVALRNELQQHGGGKVTFPRFDLGALLALTAPSEADSLLNDNNVTIPSIVQKAMPLLSTINEMGSVLGDLTPFMKPLVTGLKLALEIPEVRKIFLSIDRGKALNWYQANSDDVILKNSHQNPVQILLRLQVLSRLDNPERTDVLVEDLLPRAFIADLCESMHDATTNAVAFMDSFEVLLNNGDTGYRLLKMLTKSRTYGETDPLLLVIGSQKLILGSNDAGKRFTPKNEEQSLEEEARERLAFWYQQLPCDRTFLEPDDLCLPMKLASFSQKDTRSYFQQFSDGLQFMETQMIEAIQEVTLGHPIYVALVAGAILKAQAQGQKITRDQILDVRGPAKNEHMRERLLSLFLNQLSKEEQYELIFCAVPRAPDVETIRVVLDLPSNISAQNRLNSYRDFTFVQPDSDRQQLVLIPLVRELLLQKLPSDSNDYYQIHTRLQQHYHTRVEKGDEQAQIEEAYHALALGNPESAIQYAVSAQQHNMALWKPLLVAISQAPAELLPTDTQQRAARALNQAKQNRHTEDCVTAIILYTCLLGKAKTGTHEIAHLQHSLGDTYCCLPGGDRQSNLQKAIDYYQLALQVFQRETYPDDWSETWNDLGNIYRELPGGDRQENLQKAIQSYDKALEIRTPETFPRGWAETKADMAIAYLDLPLGNRQNNLLRALNCCRQALWTCTPTIFPVQWACTQHRLGMIYSALLKGVHQDNLLEAIKHYNEALRIRKRDCYDTDWASTQNNLGNVYLDLEGPDRQANLREALSHYTAAEEVLTYQAHRLEWAIVQNNLGIIYSELPSGDRQANMQQAIHYYEQALRVHTKEAFPKDWATTRDNLGTAYWALPGGDKKDNLQKAIECHLDALKIFTRNSDPLSWAAAKHNLGNAYRDLPEGDRQANVQNAIGCYTTALEEYTRETYPHEWAETQADLGIAYWALPEGDRKANLAKAKNCYITALKVCTPKNYCEDWAMIQHNLGNVYRDWPVCPGEDRQTSLLKAIRCYEAALEVRKPGALPIDWAETQNELGCAYRCWQDGDQRANLQKAMSCYQKAAQVYQSMHIDYKAQEVSKNLEDTELELHSLV